MNGKVSKTGGLSLAKIVEIILPLALAALTAFLAFIWEERVRLGDELNELRSKVAKIEASGEVQIAKIAECEKLWDAVLQKYNSTNTLSREAAEGLFKQRGCDVTNAKGT